MSDWNPDYFRQRAIDECQRAEQAQDPTAAWVHRQMAEHYEGMLDQLHPGIKLVDR